MCGKHVLSVENQIEQFQIKLSLHYMQKSLDFIRAKIIVIIVLSLSNIQNIILIYMAK